MRKITFLFVLLSTFVFSQTQQEVEEIAKKYFEEQYVQKNFKDPYSYELKKMTTVPKTREQVLNNEISLAREMAKPPTSKKTRKEYELQIKEKTDLLNSLSATEKSAVYEYNIHLDTYGANSYGNKVLGKYLVVISADGKEVKRVFNMN